MNGGMCQWTMSVMPLLGGERQEGADGGRAGIRSRAVRQAASDLAGGADLVAVDGR
jgi:hypothetical protein